MTTKLILSLGKAPYRLPAYHFNKIVPPIPPATYKLRPSRVAGGEKAAAVFKEAPTRLCLKTSAITEKKIPSLTFMMTNNPIIKREVECMTTNV